MMPRFDFFDRREVEDRSLSEVIHIELSTASGLLKAFKTFFKTFSAFLIIDFIMPIRAISLGIYGHITRNLRSIN